MEKFLTESIPSTTHEQVLKFTDTKTGLKAIIALHNTNRGPGLGGCRIYNYTSESDALTDALRLSKGMSYKNALACLNIGGGKAVIIGNPQIIKNPENLQRFGEFVETLNGKYVTAPDVNTDIYDMNQISTTTKHVVCLSEDRGGSGDPSYMTAYGVYMGLKAAAKHTFGTENLNGKKIGIEGIGKVGTFLVEMLSKENSVIYVTDINQDSLTKISQKYKVKVINLANFIDTEMDIYAPCAMGATINDDSINRLKCKIIAGAANNQLAEEEKHGNLVFQNELVYLPDYAINAGGVITAYTELISEYSFENAKKNVENIYNTCLNILQLSQKQNKPTHVIANVLAEKLFTKES